MARPQLPEPTIAMQNSRHSLPKRRSLRLQGYDYRNSGVYFVTICTAEKRPLFGTVRQGAVHLNELGQLADRCWKQIERIRSGIELDAYIVMPNHIHGILLLSAEAAAANASAAARGPTAGSLGAVLAQYKSTVTKRSRFTPSPLTGPIWQRNYYDHIIRSASSLDRIRQYIVENPARWMDDDLHVG